MNSARAPLPPPLFPSFSSSPLSFSIQREQVSWFTPNQYPPMITITNEELAAAAMEREEGRKGALFFSECVAAADTELLVGRGIRVRLEREKERERERERVGEFA
jgi:hypothetical protein